MSQKPGDYGESYFETQVYSSETFTVRVLHDGSVRFAISHYGILLTHRLAPDQFDELCVGVAGVQALRRNK